MRSYSEEDAQAMRAGSYASLQKVYDAVYFLQRMHRTSPDFADVKKQLQKAKISATIWSLLADQHWKISKADIIDELNHVRQKLEESDWDSYCDLTRDQVAENPFLGARHAFEIAELFESRIQRRNYTFAEFLNFCLSILQNISELLQQGCVGRGTCENRRIRHKYNDVPLNPTKKLPDCVNVYPWSQWSLRDYIGHSIPFRQTAEVAAQESA